MRIFPQQIAHPWHGISAGSKAPAQVSVYIEIVPSDTVKYELDKESGLLKVDRPQKYSNVCPTPYGFIPRTYCGDSVADFCMQQANRSHMKGDGDPLDICILTEKIFPHGNILLQAIPIGGLRMIDDHEADDKIIAVLKDDISFGQFTDIAEVPPRLIERLKHYFLTYKLKPTDIESANHQVEITHVYSKEEAHQVIQASLFDYQQLQEM